MRSKRRLRLLAAASFVLGTVLFVGGMPSRVPEEQVAAARQAYEEWSRRHNADILQGRPSRAGAPPAVETTSPAVPAVITLGFVFMLAGSLVFALTFM